MSLFPSLQTKCRLICDVGLSSGVQVLEETKSDLGQRFFLFFLSVCNVLLRDKSIFNYFQRTKREKKLDKDQFQARSSNLLFFLLNDFYHTLDS